MSFGPDELRESLDSLGAASAGRWLVAFSGGLDSTALLAAILDIRERPDVLAVHVNHGLQDDASDWERHCRELAAELGVDFQALRVSVAPCSGEGPEAAARRARYSALASILLPGDWVLSAHHRDDQAETLLLNLMRASGPLGLSGMSASRPLGAGRLARPLLGVSRAALEDWTRSRGLDWIEDPSNAESRFDRNFLRNEIVPLLDARFRSAGERLARSADLLGETSGLIDDLAAIDLETAGGNPARLAIPPLLALDSARRRNLLRFCLRMLGLPSAPGRSLAAIESDLLPAREDASPLVAWQGSEARRYRDSLFLGPTLAPAPEAPVQPGPDGFALGELGSFELSPGDSEGIDPAFAELGFEVRFRAGGESLRPVGGDCTKSVKKLFQEAGVLPWMRDRVPLLYAGDRLVAVGDLWIEQTALTRPGLGVHWNDAPAIR